MQPRLSHWGAGVGSGAGGFTWPDCPPMITVLLLSLTGPTLVTVTLLVCGPVVTLLPELPPELVDALAPLLIPPLPLEGVCIEPGRLGKEGAGAGVVSSRERSERLSAASAGVASKREPTSTNAAVVRIRLSLLGVRKTKFCS